ncbi:hypothetical protein ACVINI_006485 [Rhizobium beringeri]
MTRRLFSKDIDTDENFGDVDGIAQSGQMWAAAH